MNERFVEIVREQVLPLFPGSELLSSPQLNIPVRGRNHCSLGNGKLSLIVREELDSNEYLLIKRQQLFSIVESNVVDLFIIEILSVGYLTIRPEYSSSLYSRCLEISIIKSVSTIPDPIEKAIELCDYWSGRTYEGGSTAFSIKIPLADSYVGFDLSHFKQDFFAALTNGYDDCLELDARGRISSYHYLEDFDDQQSAPFRFLRLSKFSEDGIIVALTRSSNILIFKETNLRWSKKNGQWVYYDHETCKTLIAGGSHRTAEIVRHNMYLSALDVSFTRTGGILACVDAGKVSKLLADGIIDTNDLVSSGSSDKVLAIKSLIGGKTFHGLHRGLRAELASMDGALVFDTDGTILAVGAIIKIPGGSHSGSRAAATMELSKYGTAIKISNDTYIECFRKGVQVFYIA